MTSIYTPEIVNHYNASQHEFDLLNSVILPVYDQQSDYLLSLILINYSQGGTNCTYAHDEWSINDADECRVIMHMIKQIVPNFCELVQNELGKQMTVNLRNKITLEIMLPKQSITDSRVLALDYLQQSRDLFIWRIHCSKINNEVQYRMDAVVPIENPQYPQWWNQYLYLPRYMYPFLTVI